MRIGDKKTFVLMPFLGLIEAGSTMKELMSNINQAEVDQEIKEKKILKRLRKEHPGCAIEKLGNGCWIVKDGAPLD